MWTKDIKIIEQARKIKLQWYKFPVEHSSSILGKKLDFLIDWLIQDSMSPSIDDTVVVGSYNSVQVKS